MPAFQKLSILIPVYNEEKTLLELLDRVAAAELPAGLSKQMVVVDDGSSDGTRKLLEKLHPDNFTPCELAIEFQEKNAGKGAAIRRALELSSGDLVIIQDADLEYDPAEYPAMLGPILDGRADVVYGSRFLGGPHRVLYFWHYVGNKFLTLLSNMLTNLNLSDMETCYKAFRRDVFGSIQLRSNRFELEPEITMKVAKLGFRVYETPISYSGRSYSEGKKITWLDGVRTLWALFRFRLMD